MTHGLRRCCDHGGPVWSEFAHPSLRRVFAFGLVLCTRTTHWHNAVALCNKRQKWTCGHEDKAYLILMLSAMVTPSYQTTLACSFSQNRSSPAKLILTWVCPDASEPRPACNYTLSQHPVSNDCTSDEHDRTVQVSAPYITAYEHSVLN
jgi:hypothetical protein